MTGDRLDFLYGEGFDADDWDLDDLDVRSRLLERTFTTELSPARMMGYEIVANQIYADEPPEVWSTVQRLSSQGIDRPSIFSQLSMAFAPVMKAALDRGDRWDPAAYAKALERLPLPTAAEIESAMIEAVRASQGIAADDLDAATLERLGRDADDEAVMELVDRVMDQLVDELGPLAWTAGDHTVHVGDLTDEIVLTHVLTDAERGVGALDAAFDLAGFYRRDDLTLPTGEPIKAFSVEHGHLGWMGPDGWLEPYRAGSVLAVRVEPGGVVRLVALDTSPAVDDELVARLRAAYDREVDEPWLPVSGEDLVLAMLLEAPDSFRQPGAPLSELAEAAGLERHMNEVAHDDTVWHNEVRSRRIGRVFASLEDDRDRVLKVLHVVDVADLVSGIDPAAVPEIEGPVDTAMLREVLVDLRDEDVLSAVAEELFDRGELGERPRAEAFIAALRSAAAKPRDIALTRLLAAFHAEHSFEPVVAEQELKLAHEADPTLGIVTDRLAWYASDRGDAARASRLWRELEPTAGLRQDLEEVDKFATPTRARLGRNEPCWCGSGRKFKQCHLGSVELPPLPDRVGWLCRKAVGFLERHGPEARADVVAVVLTRAVDADDQHSIIAAFEDPIVMDLVLTEGGWFERFLEERGELLPDDELLLAQSWVLVDRSVYEVLEARAGEGLELRDLRTGDRLEVRERTFSRETSVGALVCARAVPDGESHQFVGGLFPVAPGREVQLLDLLDEGDPEMIAAWVAGLYRLPALQTQEGEASVQCEIAVDVGEPDAARDFLDATYEPDESTDGDAWVELFPLNEDEEILRARLTLEGSRLSVSTTSEQRAERVLAAIRAALPAARVVHDERTPMDMKSMLRRQRLEESLFPHDAADPGSVLDAPEMVGLMEEMRDRYEERWCNESVPALGGLTPRQAADDPTRRGELERLLTSFEVPVRPGTVTMRPQRLRELLDL